VVVGVCTASVALVAGEDRIAAGDLERQAALAKKDAEHLEELVSLKRQVATLTANEQALRVRLEQQGIWAARATDEQGEPGRVGEPWYAVLGRPGGISSRLASRSEPSMQLTLTKSVDLVHQPNWSVPVALAAYSRIELAEFDCAMLLEFVGHKLFLRVRPETGGSVVLDRASDGSAPVTLTRLGGAKCTGRVLVYSPNEGAGDAAGDRTLSAGGSAAALSIPPAAGTSSRDTVAALPLEADGRRLPTGASPAVVPPSLPPPAAALPGTGESGRLADGFPAPPRKPTPPPLPAAARPAL
jgi:hypothetical protein